MNDINEIIQSVLQARSMGKDPNMIVQMLVKQNPNLQQMMVRMQNMAKGRNVNEFVMQMAKQNGVNEQNIQALQQIFGNK